MAINKFMPSGIYKRKPSTRVPYVKKGHALKLSEEHKENIRKSMIGKNTWMKGRKLTEETKVKIKNSMIGEKNHQWRGGITQERDTREYDLWRLKCLKRDNFTCQKYGIVGKNLEVHHILNYCKFPEHRLNIDNGITLSEKAHREFHKKYGKKNNTLEQLNEFLGLN